MKTTEQLKQLLANLWVLFFNARNAHWNIEGPNFKELHDFFAGIYSSAETNADDVAEMIRQLGDYAPALMGEYLSTKTITDKPESLTDFKIAMMCLQNDYTVIIALLKAIIEQSASEKDWATNNLCMAICQQMQKDLWMIEQYLK